jgi:hypothetical protein
MPAMLPSHAEPDDRVEAVVAGTLCLMSCYANDPRRCHAERIAGNLALLADDPDVTAPMRTLCRRLSERWDALAAHVASTRQPDARMH